MRNFLPGALFALIFAIPTSINGQSLERMRALSQREKTFLELVFKDNEPKALEYIQVAGINPNSIAGEPLSTWFYRMGYPQQGPTYYHNLNVQRFVFETLKQNINPTPVGESRLDDYCRWAPQPDQKRYVDAMVAGFASLVRYGLKDRAVISAMFKACVTRSGAPLDDYFFNAVLAPMIKAGADINFNNGEPLQIAVKTINAPFVESLVHAGANVRMTIPAQCGMQQIPSSLYGWLLSNIDTKDRAGLLRITALLSKAGLSPFEKATYVTMNGYGSCVTKSLYDAAVDRGDLEFAKQIKEAAGSGAASASPPQANAAPAAAPAQFGAWRIAIENGRPVAMAKADKMDGDHLAGIRLECLPTGRLEYRPVALRNFMATLWVNGMNDTTHTIPLTSGRTSGTDSAFLSKELLGSEANYNRDGTAEWGIEMSIDGPEASMENIRMTGFSQARSYMLANCKKQG